MTYVKTADDVRRNNEEHVEPQEVMHHGSRTCLNPADIINSFALPAHVGLIDTRPLSNGRSN